MSRGGFYNDGSDKRSEWQQYVRSCGGVGKLKDLMKQYGIHNCRLLYNSIELGKGELMGIAHGEYIVNLFEQKFQSPINARLELDENGDKWLPGNDLRLQLISEDICGEVLRLLPMVDEDERTEWINKAITISAVDKEWESLPFIQFYDDEIEKINNLSREISYQVKTAQICSWEDLKHYLLQKWIRRKGPKILM